MVLARDGLIPQQICLSPGTSALPSHVFPLDLFLGMQVVNLYEWYDAIYD